MTHFLVSAENEEGHRLEDILTAVRGEVVKRCGNIVDDHRDEAHQVLENNIRVLALLSDAIKLAENSTYVLDRSFGPSESADGGEPRIGRK